MELLLTIIYDLISFLRFQPFFHILALDIQNRIGESDPQSVIATTMAAFALSSILTGTYTS